MAEHTERDDAPAVQGRLTITEKALSKIIAAAILSVPGTTRIESNFSRSYPRIDVQLDADGDTMSADIVLATTWPAPTINVAERVRDTVDQHVRRLTGIRPVRLNVATGPVTTTQGGAPATPVTVHHLEAHSPQPTPKPIKVDRIALRPISRGAQPQVQQPTITPQVTAIASPSVAPSWPLRKVRVAPQRVVTPTRITKAPKVRSISAPPKLQVAPVRVVPSPMKPVRVAPNPRAFTRPVRVQRTPVLSVRPPVPVTPVPVVIRQEVSRGTRRR